MLTWYSFYPVVGKSLLIRECLILLHCFCNIFLRVLLRYDECDNSEIEYPSYRKYLGPVLESVAGLYQSGADTGMFPVSVPGLVPKLQSYGRYFM